MPAGQTAFEDVDQEITGISVHDPDVGDRLTVSLSVGHGTLTLRTTDGLTVLRTGIGAVELTGSGADLNAALANLVYRGSLNFREVDSLQVSVSDGERSDSRR